MSSSKADQILQLIRRVDDKLSSLSHRVSNVEKIVAKEKEGNRRNFMKDAQNWISSYTKDYRKNGLARVTNCFFQLIRWIFWLQKQPLRPLEVGDSLLPMYAD